MQIRQTGRTLQACQALIRVMDQARAVHLVMSQEEDFARYQQLFTQLGYPIAYKKLEQEERQLRWVPDPLYRWGYRAEAFTLTKFQGFKIWKAHQSKPVPKRLPHA
jgi:hypothetical protein